MAKDKVGKVMGEFKAGTLHSGSQAGPKVKSRKQAIAIGLSEARKAGEPVKPPRSGAVAAAKASAVRKGRGPAAERAARMRRLANVAV